MDSTIAFIVPALNPGEELKRLVSDLGERRIVVVDDGSGENYIKNFSDFKNQKNVTLLTHAVNMGKGAALKTAYNYLLVHHPELKGAVTFDADGQHALKDILHLGELFKREPTKLIFGVRDFSNNKPPFRSWLGNRMTQLVFWLFVGHKMSDTQTGLRALPRKEMLAALKIPANGYDFEFDSLVQSIQRGTEIREVPIETIYEDGNKSSHFRPLRDSLQIYFVFIRFTFSSLVTTLVDNLIFILQIYLTQNLLTSICTGRFVATLTNFYLNKKLVFKNQSNSYKQFAKFALLVVIMTSISYLLINLLVEKGYMVIPAKICIEVLLFASSFVVQRFFIFGRSRIKSS